ncbi:MAG TPA: cyclohexanecarboxylate-CoA ligase [Micromonosporaceae bacterium]|nr:cyclohexanecarboxylate-CoA ligase [Micromonosporaceae bacterium]
MSTGTTKIPVLSDGDRQRAADYLRSGLWHDKPLTAYLDEFAQADPDRVFVTDGVRSLTYAQLRSEAYRLAASFRGLGVNTGDRVVVQLPNWAEFVTTYLALIRIGAVLVPIMPIYRHNEVQYLINHSEAIAVVTAGNFRNFDYQQMYRDLRGNCPSLKDIIVARGEAFPGSTIAFEDLVHPDRTELWEGEEAPADAPHAIVYTSGTEARPKGCCHTWHTIGFNVRGLSRDVLRVTAADVMFMPSPITHSTGLVLGVGVPLAAGAALHLMDAWEPNEGVRRMVQYGATMTATATPFVRMALDTYDKEEHDLSAMRVWLCAGAPIPPALVEEVSERLPGCRLLPVWGCSEVMAGTACSLDDPLSASINSDGRAALSGVELKIVTVEGREAAIGEEGEICYRGPGRMLGYWGAPERTAAAIDADGWYHTSDLARMAEGGYIRITGRIKDIIIRGGTNISAREIEDHVITHPKVAVAAAIGVPDEKLGERMCLFVVPAGDEAPTLAELSDYLKNEKQIATHKLPERLAVVDALPMTATGKIQKFELRRLALEAIRSTTP